MPIGALEISREFEDEEEDGKEEERWL